MLKALSAPYPAVKYIPTGGIDPTNLAGYLSFSNVLACGGSWMVRDELISQGRFDEITRLCGEAVKLVSGYRARGNASEYAGNGDQHIRRETQPVATGKVVCFGEIMMRLSPPGFQRFVQANSFDLCFGGSEANVSVSLAEFGVDAAFVTRLPDDPRGQSAVNELRRYSVDTGDIARGGDRIGIYFLEKGASQRPSKVIYDRKNSSFAQAKPGDFDWDSIFKGAAWFHFSGITPALGEAAAQLTLEAAAAAKKQGLKVSCDLNYRKNLWSPEKAGEVMAALMQQVDVFIANEEQVGTIFGIHAEDADDAATQLAGRFRLEKVAVTLRSGASASENQWSAMLLDGGEVFNSKSYSVHIVDRVGGGDAFAAGLIFALLKGYRSQEALEFAVAASCLKHSVEGDFNHVAVEEVRALLEGDGSGRVQR
jgi:2-dehydro-3-deoxygluconokinase